MKYDALWWWSSCSNKSLPAPQRCYGLSPRYRFSMFGRGGTGSLTTTMTFRPTPLALCAATTQLGGGGGGAEAPSRKYLPWLKNTFPNLKQFTEQPTPSTAHRKPVWQHSVILRGVCTVLDGGRKCDDACPDILVSEALVVLRVHEVVEMSVFHCRARAPNSNATTITAYVGPCHCRLNNNKG